MSANAWAEIERLLHAANALPPSGRAAFLAAIPDPHIRAEVSSLVDADSCDSGSAIGRVIGDVAALATSDPLSFGHFRVTAELGRGAMGAVYRARDLQLGRDVALKILAPEFATDAERLARFEREARLLASLNHPNIATVYGVEHGALVMEVVEGPTLAERIERGPVPLNEALGIAEQIAEALAYAHAHARGVVHRDLKPANIKISPDGRVKILDFGLAKALTPDEPSSMPIRAGVSPSNTLPGVMIGTAGYMAPEQTRGQSVDQRADIWAFGVVLFEMLAGRRPFDGDTVSDTLAQALTAEPDFTRVPAAVRSLLGACLQKDPRQRLHAIDDYRLLLHDSPSSLRRRPMARWAAVGVLAGAAILIGWRFTPSSSVPFAQFDADLGAGALLAANTTVALSPDGSRIVFSARGADGTPQLAVRLLGQPTFTLLAETDRAVDPFFSPDGQWVGFFADRKLKKVPIAGGAAATICDAPVPRGAAWGADGHIILMPVAGAFGLSRVPAAGGTPQVLTRPSDRGEVTHRWPQILPGGDTVLFTASAAVGISYDDATINALSLKTGEWKIVQRGGYFGRYLPGGYLVYLHQGTLYGVKFDPRRLEVTGTPVPLLEDVAGNAGTGAGQFDFAINGTFVYLKNGAAATWPLLWLHQDGTTSPLLQTPGSYLAPRFSPDGKRLAVTVGLVDVRIYDWERDTMTRVGFTNQRNAFPVWAPDGKHLVFESQALSGSSLYWIRADGAAEPHLLVRSKSNIRPNSFSPDGRYLAFSEQDVDAGFSVGTLSLDLTDPERPKPGTPAPFVRTRLASEPAFSPDGRWIAYASNESARREVYVQPFPGTGSSSGKWQVSSGGGHSPIWSANRRELFYESDDNRIMAATYSAGKHSFAAQKPRMWSPTQLYQPNAAFWNFDLAPDGSRFVIVPRPEAGGARGTVHVTFLLNFFDEVQRRLVPR